MKKQKKNKTSIKVHGSSSNKKSDLLEFSTAQKIVQQFLTERRIIQKPTPHVVEKMTIEELAKELGVKPKKLRSFNSADQYARIDSKIPRTLIDIYCNTAWEHGKYREK
jgi:ATP-dependent DNA ligase